jgi:hypothetical protein
LKIIHIFAKNLKLTFMQKFEISEEKRNEILSDYDESKSIRKTAKKYNYTFQVIQKIINSHNYDENIKQNYPQKEGYDLIAVCKKTKKRN